VVPAGRDLLGDRYELVEPVKWTAQGDLWLGRDTVRDRAVLVEVFPREQPGSAAHRARIRLVAALDHPNLWALEDHGVTTDGAYVVREHIEAQRLSALLADADVLPVDRTLDVLAQAAAGLAAAHERGLVHGALQASSLLVCADGRVKVDGVGESPAAARPSATPAGDLRALGRVVERCLAGRRTFDPVTVARRHLSGDRVSWLGTYPPAVRTVVRRLLSTDPDLAFPDAASLAAAVAALQGAGAVPPLAAPAAADPTPGTDADPSTEPATATDDDASAPPAPPVPVIPEPRSGRRHRLTVAAVVLAAVSVGLGIAPEAPAATPNSGPTATVSAAPGTAGAFLSDAESIAAPAADAAPGPLPDATPAVPPAPSSAPAVPVPAASTPAASTPSASTPAPAVNPTPAPAPAPQRRPTAAPAPAPVPVPVPAPAPVPVPVPAPVPAPAPPPVVSTPDWRTQAEQWWQAWEDRLRAEWAEGQARNSRGR
jgi:hypothetical protein